MEHGEGRSLAGQITIDRGTGELSGIKGHFSFEGEGNDFTYDGWYRREIRKTVPIAGRVNLTRLLALRSWPASSSVTGGANASLF